MFLLWLRQQGKKFQRSWLICDEPGKRLFFSRVSAKTLFLAFFSARNREKNLGVFLVVFFWSCFFGRVFLVFFFDLLLLFFAR